MEGQRYIHVDAGTTLVPCTTSEMMMALEHVLTFCYHDNDVCACLACERHGQQLLSGVLSGICQGIIWHHLNQLYVAGTVCYFLCFLREREREVLHLSSPKADSGAAWTSPGRSQEMKRYASTQRRTSL